MTRQLPLQIVTRVRYSPENFLVHAGVKNIVEECRGIFARDLFGVAFIHGARRSGKTHLSIYLVELLSKLQRFPRILEGGELASFLESGGADGFSGEDVIVVDNAEVYLEKIQPGYSGPFVAFVEKLRVARAGLILLSRAPLDGYGFDEHIRSRLLPGTGFQVAAPAETDMRKLVDLMARQRGILLKERKIEYLLRRVGRDIEGLERYFDRVRHLADVLGQSFKLPVLGEAL